MAEGVTSSGSMDIPPVHIIISFSFSNIFIYFFIVSLSSCENTCSISFILYFLYFFKRASFDLSFIIPLYTSFPVVISANFLFLSIFLNVSTFFSLTSFSISSSCFFSISNGITLVAATFSPFLI